MRLLGRLPLGKVTPVEIWAEMSPEVRYEAARALYDRGWEDSGARAEADLAIAAALRFRQQAVRKLPQDKRARYLVQAVRPGESLAMGLLMALHLVERHEMLETFLDELGIPQKGGVIEEGHVVGKLDRDRLAAAVLVLRERFPQEHVDLYVASLLAMDPEVWADLAEIATPSNG